MEPGKPTNHKPFPPTATSLREKSAPARAAETTDGHYGRQRISDSGN